MPTAKSSPKSAPKPAPQPTGPLKGLRVLSISLNLPGPAALQRLHQLGARCQKIEPPSGDPMRHFLPQAYADLHQGVRVSSADLKTAAGQATLHKALTQTDVLLTSFRPSALRKLGLGWAALHKRYPHLCQIAIVGAPGEAAEIAGHDLTYMAEAGLTQNLEMPPTLFADMGGALAASEAAMAAIIQRTRTGKGNHREVALSTAALFLGLPKSWGLTSPQGVVGGAHAGYRIYACQDGRVAVAALEPHFAQRLADVAAIKAPKEGALDWRAPIMRKRLTRFFAGHTRASLDAIAASNDLPLHTLAN